MMNGWWSTGIAGMGLMAVIWFIIQVVVVMAIIVGVVYFVRWVASGGNNRHFSRYDEAMEILRQRYARGEISDQQFEEMKEKLRH